MSFKVTLHLAPGQSLKDLIGAVKVLNGGEPVRTVAGRVGVLVDAEVAHRYLGAVFGTTMDEIVRAWIDEVDTAPSPELAAVIDEAVAVVVAEEPAPAPARPKKAVTKKPPKEV